MEGANQLLSQLELGLSFFLFKSEIISALARLSIDSTTIDNLPVRFRSQFKHAQSEQMECAGR